MSEDWHVRTLAEDEWAAYVAVEVDAFASNHEDPEELQVERSVHEVERSVVATGPGATRPGGGEEFAGIATIYSFQMTVPGGPTPVAGVSWVSVRSTARRRGVLTAMMRHQLHGLHESGAEPVAALWASEPAIYPRFGYGAASRHVALTIPRGPAVLAAPDGGAGLTVRVGDPGEMLDLVEPVYDAQRLLRPGVHERDARWRRRELWVPPDERPGATALRCAVVADEQGPRAYARYQIKRVWGTGGPDGVVRVREAFAADPAACGRLWSFLCDLDLTSSVEVRPRPVDDPLLDMLVSLPAARPQLRDGLHVRLVDLDRALAARAYSAPLDVVLEVADGFCPWNAGRWRLTADPSGAQCRATSDPADLALGVRELGSAYLGASAALSRLAAAGRVHELRPGALAEASRAFSWEVQPWSPTVW